MGSCGTTANALAFGGNTGSPTTATEEWTGAGAPQGAWTTISSLNIAREGLAGAGIYTSALVFGGEIPPSGVSGDTESWNGSSWTDLNNLNTSRRTMAGAGASNTSALAFGGWGPSIYDNTETWNGTNWTEVNDLNTGRVKIDNAGCGTQTSALLAGGGNPTGTAVNNCET